jgi:pteridine reductase
LAALPGGPYNPLLGSLAEGANHGVGMKDLRGRTALVTGAAKRIGRAIALRLAREGVHIAFSYLRSAAEAEEARREIEALGVRCAAVRADLGDLDACDRLIERAAELAGGVDILVNNASDFPRTPLEELAGDRAAFADRFRALADLHLRAPLYLGMQLGLAMRRRGEGSIVNILDRVVVRGQAYAGWALYLTTKYGWLGVNQVLAVELAPEVTVNAVAPGLVIPPEDLPGEEVSRLVARIPLRREMGVEEIAEDVLHLVRSEGKTGSTILSDGGTGLRTF